MAVSSRSRFILYYTDLFQKVHFIENVTKYDNDSHPRYRHLWQ